MESKANEASPSTARLRGFRSGLGFFLAPEVSGARNKLNLIFLTLIVILGFSWRFLLIAQNYGFMFDEGYDFIQAQNSIQTLITGRYSDSHNHPFLHYLFLHFWTKINTSEFFLRLPFLIFGIIGILGMFFLAKGFFQSGRLGLLAAFLTASSAFSVVYSAHVRITQAFLTMEILALFFYLRAVRQNKWGYWVSYSLFSIIALYLEYAAFWQIAILVVHFLILCRKDNVLRTNFKKWLWAQAIIIISYLPWLPIFLSGLPRALATKEYLRSNTILGILETFLMGTNGFSQWVLSCRAKGLSETMRENLTIGSILLFLSYFLVFISSKLINKDPKMDKGKVIFLSLFSLPLIIAQLMSFFGILILHDRNQTIFIIGFILMLVYVIKLSKTKIEKSGAFSLVAIFLVVNVMTIDYYFHHPLGETWREAAIFLRENLRSGNLVIASERANDWPMLYYLKYRYPYPFEKNNVVFLNFEPETQQRTFELIKGSKKKHLWLFGSAWEIETFDNGDFWGRFVDTSSDYGLKTEDFKLLNKQNLWGIILYEGVYEG